MDDAMTGHCDMIGKSTDAVLLREMIGFAAGKPMGLEVGGLTGAAHGEKSAEWQVQRNGCRDRDREIRAGKVELRTPRPRKSSYFPGFPAPRWMAEKAPTAMFEEAYFQRVSTRSDTSKNHAIAGVGARFNVGRGFERAFLQSDGGREGRRAPSRRRLRLTPARPRSRGTATGCF